MKKKKKPLYCLATQAQAKLKMEKKRDNNWLGSHISSGEEVLRWIVIGRSELSLNNLRESPCSSNTEPSALTARLLDKAMALACLWYSWPRMLKVAPCTVLQLYSRTSKFFWLDGLLLFCINLSTKVKQLTVKDNILILTCNNWAWKGHSCWLQDILLVLLSALSNGHQMLASATLLHTHLKGKRWQ